MIAMINGFQQKLRAITLMYHDVTERHAHESSGFPWPDAALYKLEPDHFDQHLASIASVCQNPIRVHQLSSNLEKPWMITFDDGGVSAYTHIADKLEERGWRGHFFVTTDYIGAPGFMDRRQIIELHQRGHIIGSHSCSHPLRMANCSWQQMLREWKVSTAILSELLGRQIETASIPGGHYSLQVAESASEAGVKILFTSEPKDSCEIVGGCLTLGRYSIQRWTTPHTVAAIASGKLAPRAWQTFLWESKKLIKNVGGQYYLKLRTSLSGKS